MADRRCLVPDVVSGQRIVTMKSTDSARAAARAMDRDKVSLVLAVDDAEGLCGIFTVRDVARRIVVGGLDPDETRLEQVMTRDPKGVSASESPHTALRLMQNCRFRHLPVTEDGTPGGKLVGAVSRRNFFPEEETLLKFEDHLWEQMR